MKGMSECSRYSTPSVATSKPGSAMSERRRSATWTLRNSCLHSEEPGRQHYSEVIMNPTHALSRAGQSLWLDNITRDLLSSGTLARYIEEWSVTGLTSNPTIFNQAIKKGTAYDAGIRAGMRAGLSGEKLIFALAPEDVTRAAGAS